MTEPAADAPPEAWAPEDVALYRAQAPRLLALAAALAGPSEADDVVSAAVLRSFTTPGWREVTEPAAYLTRAVVNEVRSGHRRSLRRSAREARYARSPEGRSTRRPRPARPGAARRAGPPAAAPAGGHVPHLLGRPRPGRRRRRARISEGRSASTSPGRATLRRELG
ncbi:MAG: hypothetical protein R2711_14195 [Acidimicrobiales bacterium]